MLLPDSRVLANQPAHCRNCKVLPHVKNIPCSTEKLLHHQTPKSTDQQDQAESNDPKIYFSDCCLPKISSHAPHSGMQQPWGDD